MATYETDRNIVIEKDGICVTVALPGARVNRSGIYDRMGYISSILVHGHEICVQPNPEEGLETERAYGICSEYVSDFAGGEQSYRIGIGQLEPQPPEAPPHWGKYKVTPAKKRWSRTEDSVCFELDTGVMGEYRLVETKMVTVLSEAIEIMTKIENKGIKEFSFREICHQILTCEQKPQVEEIKKLAAGDVHEWTRRWDFK